MLGRNPALDGAARHAVTLRETGAIVGAVTADHGTLAVKAGGVVYRFGQLLDVLLGGGLLLLILYRLRGLIAAIAGGKPFDGGNVRSLRIIGWALISLNIWAWLRVLLLPLLLLPGRAPADETQDAETAAQSMVRPLERDGFVFRAEAWVKELRPEMGKAIKVQLFKGNDYRFCVAVPPKSGVKITAAVLDFEGKPGGQLRVVEQGWGLVLEYQPKKTGVHVVAIRQLAEGRAKPTICAMVTGYK